jgi:hypothetical protein
VDWTGSTSPYEKTTGPKKGGFRLPTDENYSAAEEYFNRTIPLFGNGTRTVLVVYKGLECLLISNENNRCNKVIQYFSPHEFTSTCLLNLESPLLNVHCKVRSPCE